MIPAYPNYAQGLSHATPFNYTQHVPLFIYGPGFVRPGVYPKHVGLVDIAPTTASLLRRHLTGDWGEIDNRTGSPSTMPCCRPRTGYAPR